MRIRANEKREGRVQHNVVWSLGRESKMGGRHAGTRMKTCLPSTAVSGIEVEKPNCFGTCRATGILTHEGTKERRSEGVLLPDGTQFC